jgi:DNA-binding GntR family transcriptional regulator
MLQPSSCFKVMVLPPSWLWKKRRLAAKNTIAYPLRKKLKLFYSDYNRGWYVIELSEEEIAHISNVREILEVYALKLAVNRISDVQLRRLASVQRRLIKTCIDKNWVDLVARDFQFHRQIWESSGNPILVETLMKLTRPFFAYSQAVLDSLSPELIELNIKAHQLLLDYLSKSVDLSA